MCNVCFIRHAWALASRYVEAVTRWKIAGKPTRAPDEIARFFEVCRTCEHFEGMKGKPWRGRCGVCGCYVGKHPHKLLQGNKIAMKTENCPLRRWGNRQAGK